MVWENKLYHVRGEVTGKTPEEDVTHYEIYMAREVMGGDVDIPSLIEEGDREVTVLGVARILSTYLTGFDEKGIIRNEVTGDKEALIRNYITGESDVLGDLNILDTLIKDKNLNNAVFKVSSDVKAPLLGSVGEMGLLRQYTYVNEGDDIVRIQELIDTTTGTSILRHKVGDSDPGEWILGNPGNQIKEQVNSLMTYYRNKSLNFDKELYCMKGSFRFRSIPIRYKTADSTGEMNNTLTLSPNEIPDGPVTICINSIENTGNGQTYYRTMSLTVEDLGIASTYKTIGEHTLEIVPKGTEGVELITSSGSRINDLYYRQSIESVYPDKFEFTNRLVKDITGYLGSVGNIITGGSNEEYYILDLYSSGLSDKSGYIILDCEETIYTSTGQARSGIANPVVFEIGEGQRDNLTLYSKIDRGSADSIKVRWNVKIEGDLVEIRQNLYDINGKQDIGKADKTYEYVRPGLGIGGTIEMVSSKSYEKITKVTFISQ